MVKQVEIKEFCMEDIPDSCTWIVVGPPGSGKCLAPGTPVLMFDGTIKKVEDIHPGDVLMGDDSTPRRVLTTTSGTDQMYRIGQSRADDYVVNEPHILVLRRGEEVLEITVKDYLSLSPEVRQEYKGYRIGGDNSVSDISVEPLGEGTYHGFQIDGNGRFLLGDFTVTHNTNLLEHIAYVHKHKYPVARVFVGTDGAYKRFSKVFGTLFVSNYYDEEEEKRHILRQRQCELENGKGYIGNNAINILDDVSDDPKIYRTKVMRGLFKLGSQHWNQILLLGTQYALDMPPDIRKSVSYVAIFREPEEIERKKLYTNFGGLAGSYENFCDLMDQLTGDFTCIIFKKRSQSNNMSDNVFWYKAKDMTKIDWRFGAKEVREWNKSRYNPDYVEHVVM